MSTCTIYLAVGEHQGEYGYAAFIYWGDCHPQLKSGFIHHSKDDPFLACMVALKTALELTPTADETIVYCCDHLMIQCVRHGASGDRAASALKHVLALAHHRTTRRSPCELAPQGQCVKFLPAREDCDKARQTRFRARRAAIDHVQMRRS